MNLRFGFVDVPYSARYSKRSPVKALRGKKPKPMSPMQQAYGQGETTVSVANDLEKRYHILDKFQEMYEDQITDIVIDSYADGIEAMFNGQKPGLVDSVNKKAGDIEKMFRDSLTNKEYDGKLSNVPTVAAQRGVSHLFAHPYARRAPRPSFIDTGMYQASFTAWAEK
jgi:hypothetical protein